MKMFRNAQTEVLDLPAGYDDEQSPFFVPESLRVTYDEVPAKPAGILTPEKAASAIKVLATRAASAAVPEARMDTMVMGGGSRAEEQRAQREEWRTVYSNASDALLESPTEELVLLVEHHRRYKVAVERKKVADQRATREADRRARETCPSCGVDDVKRVGRIDLRHPLPGSEESFRSCGFCFLVKESQLREEARAEVLATGGSRAEAVRAAAPAGAGAARTQGRGWGREPKELVF